MYDNEQHLKARTPWACPWVSQKIETGGNVVQIADIESILTPEQLELVKKKAYGVGVG